MCAYNVQVCYTMESLNNGHSGGRPLVHCREVVPTCISEGTECMLQSVGGKQFVCSTKVVRISECPLSEVPLYVCDYYKILNSRRRCPFPQCREEFRTCKCLHCN